LTKQQPEIQLREVGGARPSVKSSRNVLDACPPVTDTNEAVNVLLKPNEKVEGLSVVPPSVPLVLASTAWGGLGSPGNSRKICDPHDTSPRLPRVDEKPRPKPRNLMVVGGQIGEGNQPSLPPLLRFEIEGIAFSSLILDQTFGR
jgi:hypothetical protein